MKRSISIILGIILVLAFVSGCGTKTTAPTTTTTTAITTTTITATTALEEPSYASAMTDNIIDAIAEDDYAKFSRDLDQAMKDALTETAFQGLRSQLQEGVGDYVSKQYNDIVVQGEITTVVYIAKYTKVDRVAIVISFRTVDDQNQVAGLYFR